VSSHRCALRQCDVSCRRRWCRRHSRRGSSRPAAIRCVVAWQWSHAVAAAAVPRRRRRYLKSQVVYCVLCLSGADDTAHVTRVALFHNGPLSLSSVGASTATDAQPRALCRRHLTVSYGTVRCCRAAFGSAILSARRRRPSTACASVAPVAVRARARWARSCAASSAATGMSRSVTPRMRRFSCAATP
jgi:hypothetical protein